MAEVTNILANALRAYNPQAPNFSTVSSLANNVTNSISSVGDIFSKISAQRQQQAQFEREQLLKEADLAERARQFGITIDEGRADRASKEMLTREEILGRQNVANINAQNALDVANLNHRNAVALRQAEWDREAARAKATANAYSDIANAERDMLNLYQQYSDEKNNSEETKLYKSNITSLADEIAKNQEIVNNAKKEIDIHTATPEKLEIEKRFKESKGKTFNFDRAFYYEGIPNDIRKKAEELGINPKDKYSKFIKFNDQGGIDIDSTTDPKIFEKVRMLQDTIDNSTANLNVLTKAKAEEENNYIAYENSLKEKYRPAREKIEARGIRLANEKDKETGKETGKKIPELNPLKQYMYATSVLANEGFEVPDKNILGQMIIDNNRKNGEVSELDKIRLKNALEEQRERKKRLQDLAEKQKGSVSQILSKNKITVKPIDTARVDFIGNEVAKMYKRIGSNKFTMEDIAFAINNNFLNDSWFGGQRRLSGTSIGAGENDVTDERADAFVKKVQSIKSKNDLKKWLEELKSSGENWFTEEPARFRRVLESGLTLDNDFND